MVALFNAAELGWNRLNNEIVPSVENTWNENVVQPINNVKKYVPVVLVGIGALVAISVIKSLR